MIAERHAEFEAVVDAVVVDLAEVVVDTRAAQHGAGNARVDGQLGAQNSNALAACHEDFVAAEQVFKLVDKARQACDHFARGIEPGRGNIDATAAEAHVVAHHARTGERFEEVENFLALFECVHERRAAGAHLLDEEADGGSVILNAGELGEDDANVFGALGDFLAGELFDCQRVSPVVGERTEVIEAIGVRHRGQVAGALGNLFVVAVQVSEDGLEADDALSVECHIHAEDAVGGGMVRAHGYFKEFGFPIRLHDGRTVPAFFILLAKECRGCRRSRHCAAPVSFWATHSVAALCAAARANTASCGVGSYS